MGLFWDLIQHSQINEQASRTGSLEDRVAALEQELGKTRQLLTEALKRIESKFGEDLNNDGRVG